MKKNKFKIIALVCILLLTSGCGTSNYITDEDGNIIEYEPTGQMLQKTFFVFLMKIVIYTNSMKKIRIN